MNNSRNINKNHNLIGDSEIGEKINEDDLSSEKDYLNLSIDSLLPFKNLNFQRVQQIIPNKNNKFLFLVIRNKKETNNLFKTIKSISFFTTLKKKRGKKSVSNKVLYEHTPFKNDNKMIKIQVGYISFLIKFINEVIEKKLNVKNNFIDIDYNFKSNIKKEFRKKLNKKRIKDIITKAPISPKFSTYNENYNKNVYNKLLSLGHNVVLDILNKRFLFFFKDIYYKNVTKFNLSLFGFESFEIQLPSDTKMFKDLKMNNTKEDSSLYKVEMEQCAQKYFFD